MHKSILIIIFILIASIFTFKEVIAQELIPKEPSPIDVKQIHSGHSLTDPLFHPNWPGQYVNLVGYLLGKEGGEIRDRLVGKSTIPGYSMQYRWDNPPGFGQPDARYDIGDWELLCITEGVPLYLEGGSTQEWYIEGIQNQRENLSKFVNNAWENGNDGNGTPTLLWTTWTNIDNSDGPWREMLDIQGEEWENMQDYANENIPFDSPPVFLIPGHKLMARIYDDIELGLVPGINDISDFFSDNIHTNELGAYAIAMIHYSCIYNSNPKGLPRDLMMNNGNEPNIPSIDLAAYIQEVVWEIVTTYERTGVTKKNNSIQKGSESINIFPNPSNKTLNIELANGIMNDKMLVNIYSLDGKLFKSTNQEKINISSWPSGIYILKIGSSSEIFYKL
ncbi:MAG: hypothetical protein Kapaf2KO_15680 [Candidatus Kapaibacteriales bacterium]